MKKILAFIALFLLVFTFGLKHIARADVNNFVINDFSADYYVNRNDPQGSMKVVENISVDFSDFNHGLLRALPNEYKKQPLKLNVSSITSKTGAPTQYSSYQQNGNTVLKIGDPNETVTGLQQYTIEYAIQNVVTFYNDHDELYWNINGVQWGQSFDRVNATFHLPEGINVQAQKCFTGAIGNTQQACSIQKTSSNEVTLSTTRRLQPYETLTFVSSFPAGYFTKPSKKDWLRDHATVLASIIVPPIVFGFGSYLYWRKNGRDPKGRGTIIAEYEPPFGLSPLEVGIIADYQADSRDITATIIDLAVRKYLKIIETKVDKFIGKDKTKYSLELLNPDTSKLLAHESQILTGLFGGVSSTVTVGSNSGLAKGNVIEFDSLKNKFYTTIAAVRKTEFKTLVEKDFFPSDPQYAGVKLWVLAAVLSVVGFMFHSFATIGLLLAAVFVSIFAFLMRKRTEKGTVAKEKIEGFKLFLNTTEKDRLAMLQSPNSPYANRPNVPTYTVELFEKLLPYAIVLGVENQWAKKFENMYTTPPDWYSGNWNTFNSIYLVGSLSSSVSAMSSNFSAPQSSGSSGFGGGGFSGGGGGGGGGGGW